MTIDYKHQYEEMKLMVEKYQDEIVPKYREMLDKAREELEQYKATVAADMVEVVRCKDCKHLESFHDCHYHKADENGTPIFVRENDFCSYGERRDNNATDE